MFIQPHLVSSQFISFHLSPCHLTSSHLMLCLLSIHHHISSHLISSHVFSAVSAYLISFSVGVDCSHFLPCHLSFSHLIAAHLNSSLFSFPQRLHSSQFFSIELFSAFDRSPWSLCTLFPISSFLLSAHLILSVPSSFFTFMFKFAYDCIPSNLFYLPSETPQKFYADNKVQVEVGFFCAVRNDACSPVFRSHNGIVQALQDRMQFLDNLFEVFCGLCQHGLCAEKIANHAWDGLGGPQRRTGARNVGSGSRCGRCGCTSGGIFIHAAEEKYSGAQSFRATW